jgi:hypothetical protein
MLHRPKVRRTCGCRDHDPALHLDDVCPQAGLHSGAETRQYAGRVENVQGGKRRVRVAGLLIVVVFPKERTNIARRWEGIRRRGFWPTVDACPRPAS